MVRSAEPEGLLKLAEGVYAHIASPDSNAVSNSGVVILDHSVLVFDTHFTPEAAQALLGKIRAVTPKPVRFIVNSHFHPDHTHGNQAFANSQQIIGSSSTRRDILQKDLPAMQRTIGVAQSQLQNLRREVSEEKDLRRQEQMRAEIQSRQRFLDRMEKLRIVSPVVVLENTLDMRGEARRIALLHLGRGHTEGDVVLHLREERIVFAGDLFFNGAIPNTQDAHLLEWIRTLEKLLELDADRFLPGHGAVGTREDVQRFLGYLQELRALVEPAVKRGDSLEQVLLEVRMPSKYSADRFQNFFPSNVQRMYFELKEAQTESPQEGSRPRELRNP